MPLAAEEQCEALLQSIFAKAKVFLQELDGFHPFGAVCDAHDRIIPYALHDDPELPDVEAYLCQLTELLELDIQEGRYLAYAIGVDVRAELPGRSEPRDAVQIIVRHSRLDVPDRYMAYIPTDEGYRFEEPIVLTR